MGTREVKLIVDTGAAMTLILPEVLDELGYGARDGESLSRISTANEDPELGYKLRVRRDERAPRPTPARRAARRGAPRRSEWPRPVVGAPPIA
jgi:Aspartyl protease